MDLRPDDIGEKAWEDVFCRSQDVGALHRCHMTAGFVNGVVTAVKLATGSEDMSTLRSDALAVAEAMIKYMTVPKAGACKPRHVSC